MSYPLPIELTPHAERQLEEASLRWREQHGQAPEGLLDDVAIALGVIAVLPQLGAAVRNARLTGVRRVSLDRTGHSLYYRVDPGPAPAIQVLAYQPSR